MKKTAPNRQNLTAGFHKNIIAKNIKRSVLWEHKVGHLLKLWDENESQSVLCFLRRIEYCSLNEHLDEPTFSVIDPWSCWWSMIIPKNFNKQRSIYKTIDKFWPNQWMAIKKLTMFRVTQINRSVLNQTCSGSFFPVADRPKFSGWHLAINPPLKRRFLVKVRTTSNLPLTNSRWLG